MYKVQLPAQITTTCTRPKNLQHKIDVLASSSLKSLCCQLKQKNHLMKAKPQSLQEKELSLLNKNIKCCKDSSVSKVFALRAWGPKFKLKDPCKNSQAWWYMSVITAMLKWRRGEPWGLWPTNLAYLVSFRPLLDLVSKVRVYGIWVIIPEVVLWSPYPHTQT